ncbi:MAG TPA: helix-turn-helix domain-containing protein [Steroidobacteraceae bacterium]
MSDTETNHELRSLAARITAAQGHGLFPAMAQYLATMLQAGEVLIGEAVGEQHARTLGVCVRGLVQPNYTFLLEGSPGEALLHAHEEEAGHEVAPGHFGMALHDPAGRVIGFVSAHCESTRTLSEHQQCLVGIVSVLLTTELQLMRAERERAALDSRVNELQARLAALERSEVSAAATGLQRALPAAAANGLDDLENTGLHHVQREHILRVLNATRWVIEGNSGAALKLGMKPATLRHRMKKLGIARLRQQP